MNAVVLMAIPCPKSLMMMMGDDVYYYMMILYDDDDVYYYIRWRLELDMMMMFIMIHRSF